MAYIKSLRCRECGREYPIEPEHVCEFCFGPLEVVYDYEAIAAAISREKIKAGPPTIWRYAPDEWLAFERPMVMLTGATGLSGISDSENRVRR